MTIKAGQQLSIHLPIGQVLNVACPAGSLGSVTRLADQPGNEPFAPNPINGNNLTFGPYTTATRFNIVVTAGTVTESFVAGAASNFVQYNKVSTGGAAGNITCTGILITDTLISVIKHVGAGTAVTDIVDVTSQFTITASDTINNTGGSTTAGSKLVVSYLRKS